MSSIPVLVQVLLVFILVVAASARKLHLGIAAALGGLVFGLMRGLPPATIAHCIASELLDPDTILLLVLVTAIMALSAAMKKSGALTEFSRAVAAISPSRKVSMALTPLFIGTLPMPGGAVLSAPLVDALDPERCQGADRLSAINYWFRHCLELAWPLYPAFILSSGLSGIPTLRLFILNFYAPLTLFALGLVFMFKRDAEPMRRETEAADRERRARRVQGLADIGGFAPLAIVLAVYIVLDILCKSILPASGLGAAAQKLTLRYLPILTGLAAGSAFVALRYGGARVFRGSVNRASFKLAAVVLGIRVFSALLEAGDVAAAGSAELAAWGIPAIAVAMFLPLIAGLVTGVGFGYVGISFPIVLGLFPRGGALPREAAIVLAGAFGYAGMMLSPLHVCMVVTAEHFGSGLAATIRRFALPLGIFLCVASLYAFALSKIL